VYPKRANADIGYTRSVFVGEETDGTRTPRQKKREDHSAGAYKNLTQEQYPRAVAWLEKIIRDEK
jgi:hypothetical protein